MSRPSRFLFPRAIRSFVGRSIDTILPILEMIQTSDNQLSETGFKTGSTKVAVLATYKENRDEIEKYQKMFESCGYFLVVIENGASITASDLQNDKAKILARRNKGFDFGAYRDAMAVIGQPRSLILINTSMIWNFKLLSKLVKNLDSPIANNRVTYLTESLQGGRHGQSFFIHLNLDTDSISRLKDFFMQETKNWHFKRSAVKFGEKALFNFFRSNSNLKIEFLFPYEDVSDTYLELGEELTEAWIKQHLLAQVALNPTQHLWPSLSFLNFPGVKKTLISHNPAHLSKTPDLP